MPSLCTFRDAYLVLLDQTWEADDTANRTYEEADYVTDLKIDYNTLHESAQALGDINDAFDTLKSRASASESGWGSSDISGAMGSFSGDWDNHRRKIMESVEKTRQMVKQTVDGFGKTETSLAGSLQQHTSTGHEAAQ